MRTTPPGLPAPGLQPFVIDLLTALDSYDSPVDMAPLQAAYGIAPCHLGEYVRGILGSTEKSVARLASNEQLSPRPEILM